MLRFRRAASTLSSIYGKTFDKILIANRGEIACRIIKTAKKMGIQTVAIYSEPDVNALHVSMADEAYLVGPAPTSKSYLNIPNILAAIKDSGAQAVHPGYGFLSENFQFVKALDAANVTFIGPTESAMYAMGDKIQSKIIAKKAGVNTIPGYDGVARDVDHAIEIANSIGYPVMLKASAGGGGKGMRIAYNAKECDEAFRLSSAESLSFFGDNRMLVEKFVEDPRHIEIQLIGDKHGNMCWLPERECSIQRRNQKVVEEAPSPVIDVDTRRRMGEQAVALAKKVGYYSAGTCEFLVDKNKDFYFLEMNTRLQVEHPITEYITGLDLVELMIRVAADQHLPFQQPDVIEPKGWAIESRVYAEDPQKYLPSIGRLSKYQEPRGPGVRCDSGIVEGSEISVHYDPMICKLVTSGVDRAEALGRMEKALDEYVIKGVTHNIPLLRDVISHPRFIEGRLTTKFLAEEYPKGFQGHVFTQIDRQNFLATIASVWAQREANKSQWIKGGGCFFEPTGSSISSSNSSEQKSWEVYIGIAGEDTVPVLVSCTANGEFSVSAFGDAMHVALDWPMESSLIRAIVKRDDATLSPLVAQYLSVLPTGLEISFYGAKINVSIKTRRQHELSVHMKEKPKLDLSKVIISPMYSDIIFKCRPGTVVSMNVTAGQSVAEGSEIAVVEAMKMQNVLRASRAGVIKRVLVAAGASVSGDEVLVEFV